MADLIDLFSAGLIVLLKPRRDDLTASTRAPTSLFAGVSPLPGARQAVLVEARDGRAPGHSEAGGPPDVWFLAERSRASSTRRASRRLTLLLLAGPPVYRRGRNGGPRRLDRPQQTLGGRCSGRIGLAGGEDDGALDHVAQLAHVAGPA